MPNPRAQKQLALNSAVQELKTLGQPVRALGDMLASTLRGSVAATAGVGGDIRELIDLLGPEKVEALLGKRVLPTTEEMKGMLPKATSYDHPYESIGEFLPLPGTGTALKAAGYGAGRGAGALTRATGQAVSDAMINQAGPLASGPLSALAPRMAMTNVVKPKGGNWLTGSVEKTVEPMMQGLRKHELDALIRQNPNMTPERRQMLIDAQANVTPEDEAINKWIGSNLAGYMKNQMATPEDPVRKLFETRTQDIEAKYAKSMDKVKRLEQRAEAEADPRKVANLLRESRQLAEDATSERELLMQHITHFPANEIGFANQWIPEELGLSRMKGGYPTTGMGESPAAKAWETMSDQAIYGNTAESYRQPLTPSEIRQGYGSLVDENPWLTKLPSETMVYHPEGTPQDLGIDHIVDVLKQDVASGRIRPEQLNKVSMEQAVQRAAEYDLEMARKMAETRIQQQEGFPVHKDYGDQGYKWIELAPSKEKKTYAADNLPEGFKLEKDRDGFYQVRNFNVGMTPTTNSFSRNPEESIAKFNEWAKDKDFELQKALEYEGSTMGHCVGGYCPDVLEGRKRIFSLRDKKGEPHVTVETQPNPHPIGTSRTGDDFPEFGGFEYGGPYSGESPYKPSQEQLQEIHNRAQNLWSAKGTGRAGDIDKFYQQASNEILGSMPEAIIQIKGKGNKKPKEDYIPHVQDFVRGGEWTDVGDFHNTDLARLQENSDLAKWIKEKNIELPKYPTKKELDAHEADFLLEQLGPEKFNEMGMGFLKPEEGMKAGGKVSISDNPDQMWMELNEQKYGLGGAVKKAAKAAKAAAETEKSLPAVLPRAAAKTKEDIRPYAQNMAEMMSGKFVRPDPSKSQNPANKSYAQWKMEQELEHDIRPKEGVNLTPQQISDIEKQLGMLKVGISGDTSISDKILHRAGKYELQNPSEQEGGPLYGLKGNPWASNYQALKNLQTGVNELSSAYGDAPVLGQYMQMGPEGTNFAQHFADANLQAIDLSNMTQSQIDEVNRIIASGSQKSGAHPDFPGIQDPYGAYFYFGFYPELRKHWNKLMTQPTFTSKYGLPDGRVIQHAITEPELRDLPVTTTGFSQFPLQAGFDPTQLPLAEHGTYTHKLPSVEGATPTRSRYPTPAEIDFPDVNEYAIKEYRPQDITRVFQTATPRQIIDQQHIDEIKMYEELMKEYTGRKAGGAVMMSKGGEMSQVALDNLAKLKELRNKIAPVADAWTAKQAEDNNKYTPDIQQFKLPIGKAAGGEISADDLILEERLL